MDLAQVPCIREVNAIHPTFAKELGLPIRPTDVEAQKIDGTTLDTHRVVIAAFPVTDKANRVRFFKRPSWWLMLVRKDVDSYTLNGVRV